METGSQSPGHWEKGSVVTKVIFPVGDGNPQTLRRVEKLGLGDEGHIPRRGWKPENRSLGS